MSLCHEDVRSPFRNLPREELFIALRLPPLGRRLTTELQIRFALICLGMFSPITVDTVRSDDLLPSGSDASLLNLFGD